MKSIGYPISVYNEVARFASATEAAKSLGVSRKTLIRAANGRRNIGINIVIYADMPLDCQTPAKVPPLRAIPVIWEGVAYPSIRAAAKGNRALWMKIWRARKAAIKIRKEAP